MRIGFTGTRNGMTEAQKTTFFRIVSRLQPTEFHHGACIGADEDAVIAIYDLPSLARPSVHAHPGVSAGDRTEGTNLTYRSKAAIDHSQVINPTDTHFSRNRTIVQTCDVLIACPSCQPLPSSGGTAYTIGKAREQQRSLVIIWPDGGTNLEYFTPADVETLV